MRGRPWYKRYPADILHGTMSLTVAEKGAYNVVLDLIYDRGGPVPDDPKWLARQCGCSMQQWRSLRDSLIASEKLFITSDGCISNARAEREIIANEAESESFRQAGHRGGVAAAIQKSARKLREKKQKHKQSNDIEQKGLFDNPSPDLLVTESKIRQESSRFVGDNIEIFQANVCLNKGLAKKRLVAVPESREEREERKKESSLRSDSCERASCASLKRAPSQEPEGFAEWYQAYPRKVGRADARNAYKKAIKLASEEAILEGLRTYRFSPDRQYQPLPATWLNKGHWDHDTPATPPTRKISLW